MPDNVHVRVKYLDTMDNPEIRLGEDRRSLLLDFPLVSEEKGHSPRAGGKT